MDIKEQKKKLIIVAVVIVAALAVLSYLYLRSREEGAPSASDAAAESAAQGALPSFGDATNPLSEKPDVNPADKANPFNAVKTNPFE